MSGEETKKDGQEANERRAGQERRDRIQRKHPELRQDQRRQTCACGAKMNRVEKEIEGLKGTKFAAYECPKCGRVSYIETQAMKMSRLLTTRPVTKKLLSLNQSLGVVLPKEITEALAMHKGQEVEISVEGINKIVIRVIE